MVRVKDIEVLEDVTRSTPPDQGYLHLRRLRCRNLRADGSASEPYRVDVVDRPRMDAVGVLIWRRGTKGLEALTRMNLRPAAYFRKDRTPTVPDPARYLQLEEIVAGVLEDTDRGEVGILHRAAEEVFEEAGYRVAPEDMALLGAPFFVAPGILSEKIFLTHVDVTGLAQLTPGGDGSALEEGATTKWWPIFELLEACRQGLLEDAKTELAVSRFISTHQ